MPWPLIKGHQVGEAFGHALTHHSLLSSQTAGRGDSREFSAPCLCGEHHRALGTVAQHRLFLLQGERMLQFASGSVLPGLEYYVAAAGWAGRCFLSHES